MDKRHEANQALNTLDAAQWQMVHALGLHSDHASLVNLCQQLDILDTGILLIRHLLSTLSDHEPI